MATRPPLRIDVLTLFPEMFPGVLGSSILKRAAEPVAHPGNHADISNSDSTGIISGGISGGLSRGLSRGLSGGGGVRPPIVSYHVTNIRDYAGNKHQKVDQPSFGGGPGMVIQCQPVWDAVQAVEAMDDRPATRILLTPQGVPLTQPIVEELSQLPRLLMIAGHYEGIDERVIEKLAPIREISVGDYVLSGGELPAMTLIDAVVRLLPGALGHQDSAHQDSFSPGAKRLLDHPHYTRPRTWEGMDAPDVLLSGNHAKIEAWRAQEAHKRTQERRPDLLDNDPV